jgi:hypothetical protein
MRLLAVSPISEIHQLLVGQRLDGWPEVQLLDSHGTIVRDGLVRFRVSGDSASFEFAVKGVLDRVTDRRGRALPTGLLGNTAGESAVVVTVSASPETAPLEFTVRIVQSA